MKRLFESIENAVVRGLVNVRAWGGRFMADQKGAFSLKTMILGVVGLIVLGTAIPVLWPLVAGTSTGVAAMTGTDAGTTTIKSFWPVIMIVGGLGIAAGVVMYTLHKFGVMGNK